VDGEDSLRGKTHAFAASKRRHLTSLLLSVIADLYVCAPNIMLSGDSSQGVGKEN